MTLGHGMRGSDREETELGTGDERRLGASERQFVFFRYKSRTAKVFRA